MRLFCLLVFVVVYNVQVYSQDPYFNNPNQSLMGLNPSFAGSNGGFRNQLSHRIFDDGSNEQNFRKAVDLKLHSMNGGLGVTLNNYRFGNTFRATDVSLTYAHYLPLYSGTHTLVPSFNIGMRFNRLVNNFFFGSGNQITDSYVDMSAGMLFNFTRLINIGMYWFHINKPGEGTMVGKVNSRYLFHASYSVRLSQKDLVQVFYRVDIQGTNLKSQIMTNFLLRRYLILNFGVERSGEFTSAVGYKAGLISVLVGYNALLPSYRYIASDKGLQSGSWEIHLAYLVANRTRRGMIQAFENM